MKTIKEVVKSFECFSIYAAEYRFRCENCNEIYLVESYTRIAAGSQFPYSQRAFESRFDADQYFKELVSDNL